MSENESTYHKKTLELVASGILADNEEIILRVSHPWQALILPSVFLSLSLISIACLIETQQDVVK